MLMQFLKNQKGEQHTKSVNPENRETNWSLGRRWTNLTRRPASGFDRKRAGKHSFMSHFDFVSHHVDTVHRFVVTVSTA